ncbi:sortase [Geobacillus subterraneus]|uniref:Sortase n=2 Tax=Geobacillus TaxID=129337 RepID=A0ABN4NKD5_9BACL|nr:MULTISPECIES: class D sortase [Geobacillus]AMX83375.1 sortase [Geobacillus subterraneus]KZS24622.1 class D sortase [Geobacillus subterraneus]OXB90399.1 class D sortase [Geobacillus uzenensis]QIZ68005.1 class D sortase [Geobacillus subterraneus]WPZ17008.1 class D sortase [Geobacillus subterraneus]
MNRRRMVRLFGAGLITAGVALVSVYGVKWKNSLEAVKPLPAKTEQQIGAIPVKAPAPLYPDRPKTGEQIGELIIPKLNASLPIYHGTDEDELEKGVGHYAGSVLPGEADNCVLAGHRDTVFRRLGEVGQGDILIVRTSAGTFTYNVRKVRIVDADDRTVIVPKPKATLTVSTCYPFRYIGSAPQRYVLIANLVNERS